MTFSVGLFRSVMALLAIFALGGCLRSAPVQLDEEKESHFLLGRTRVSAMDYDGAAESFEKALEVNPRSAAAHFELACLFERREADAATSIYHYQQYMKLRPKADNVETVKQHILALKQELAKTVSLGVVTERQQREFERLVEENRRLNEEVQGWRAFSARIHESAWGRSGGAAAGQAVRCGESGNEHPHSPVLAACGPCAPAHPHCQIRRNSRHDCAQIWLEAGSAPGCQSKDGAAQAAGRPNPEHPRSQPLIRTRPRSSADREWLGVGKF